MNPMGCFLFGAIPALWGERAETRAARVLLFIVKVEGAGEIHYIQCGNVVFSFIGGFENEKLDYRR